MNSPARALDLPPFRIEPRDRSLLVRFARAQRALSWAVVHGGRTRTRDVVWLQVVDRDLPPTVDPAERLRAHFERLGIERAIGLLTSSDVRRFAHRWAHFGEVTAHCVATVGMSNALRAGDLPGRAERVGTINLLCHVSEPLSDAALAEALSLAAEARTVAVCESGIASRRSGRPASGTGTDCIVVTAPDETPSAFYAGKHTALGHVVGASVYEAVHAGITRWKKYNQGPSAEPPK